MSISITSLCLESVHVQLTPNMYPTRTTVHVSISIEFLKGGEYRNKFVSQ